MQLKPMGEEVFAVKDPGNERPIPTAWRPIFREIVKAFVSHDYRVSAGVPGLMHVSDDTAAQIVAYIRDYGETLVELPEETWDSSVCIWMGRRWEALIDLWTEAEGRSDLVLSAHISAADCGFQFRIYMVYVP
jgi:hypothetical protein